MSLQPRPSNYTTLAGRPGPRKRHFMMKATYGPGSHQQQQHQHHHPLAAPSVPHPPAALGYSMPPAPPSARNRTVVAAETAWLQVGTPGVVASHWLIERVASTAQLVGDSERAQGALDTILRHNPHCAAAYVRLGHLLHNQQQYVQAAEAYQKALACLEQHPQLNAGPTAPTLASIWAALAHCWLLLDDLPRAFHTYQQALSFPGGGRDMALWFGVGILYDRYGADEHALEAFSAALKLHSATEKMASGMQRTTAGGEQRIMVGGGPRTTMAAAATSLSSSTSTSTSQSTSPTSTFQSTSPPASTSHPTPAPTSTSTSQPTPTPTPMLRELYYRVGMLLRNRKHYAPAAACFEYVGNFPPAPLHRADVKLQLALTLNAQGDLARARAILEQAVVKDGKRGVAARGKALLGWILVQSGPGGADASAEQEQGLAMLRQVVAEENNGTASGPADALAWYFLGRACLARKMYTQAYEAYQEAVYRDGQNAAFWNSIGILYLEIRQFRDALDAFSRAIHSSSALPEVWWNLGLLYESSNSQLADALDAYQRAAELAPTNTAITSRVVLLKHHMGAVAAAAAGEGAVPGPLAPPTDVHEVDPLPFLPRPILLGTAQIPPQKTSPSTGPAVPPQLQQQQQSLPYHPPLQQQPQPQQTGGYHHHPAAVHAGAAQPPYAAAPYSGRMPPSRPMGLPNLPVRAFAPPNAMPSQLIRPATVRSAMPPMPATRPSYPAVSAPRPPHR